MMNNYIRIAICIFATTAALAATQAQAVQRTHVSAALGSDSNTATNCTATAPCRFFQAAMSVTDTDGEVVVLDSGGYGAVTITKSVSLTAPTGVYAGISVFPGAVGVTIATAGVNVVLRGITINGQGGTNGINMTAGSSLTVENCVISNLNANGIFVNATAIVNVTDTVVRRNGNNGIYLSNGAKGTITRAVVSGHNGFGIFVEGAVASTSTVADIADSTIDGNGIGVYFLSTNATAKITASARDSRIVRSTSNGILAQSTANALVSLSASNNLVSNSNFGITSLGATIWATGNTVSDNVKYGLYNTGKFETAGNNAVRNNGVDVAGQVDAIAAR